MAATTVQASSDRKLCDMAIFATKTASATPMTDARLDSFRFPIQRAMCPGRACRMTEGTTTYRTTW